MDCQQQFRFINWGFCRKTDGLEIAALFETLFRCKFFEVCSIIQYEMVPACRFHLPEQELCFLFHSGSLHECLDMYRRFNFWYSWDLITLDLYRHEVFMELDLASKNSLKHASAYQGAHVLSFLEGRETTAAHLLQQNQYRWLSCKHYC